MHKFLEGKIYRWYSCHLEDEESLIRHLESAGFKIINTATTSEEIKYDIRANPRLDSSLVLGHIKSDFFKENVLYLLIEKEDTFFKRPEFKRLKKFAENYSPPSYQNTLQTEADI